MRAIDRILTRQARALIVVEALVLAVLIGVVDWLTGPELSSSVFYLVPISIAAWYASRRAGTLLAVVSAIVWLVADLQAGHAYSRPAIVVWNMAVRASLFLVLAATLHALREALERERKLARTDPLTGVANGRAFHETAAREHARARRYRHGYALAFIDLDDFKSVNDRYGHAMGDEVLRAVGDALSRRLRGTDTAARLGGDEFVVLLPETDAEGTRTAIAAIQEELVSAMRSVSAGVTFSIGVATASAAPEDFETLLRRADTLVYAAKERGKNMAEFGEIAEG